MSPYLCVRTPRSCQMLPVSYLFTLSHKIQMNWVLQVSRAAIKSIVCLVEQQRFPTAAHHGRRESTSVLPGFLIQSCSASLPKQAGAEPAALFYKCFITA